VVVAALHHRQGGLTDGQDITGLEHRTGVVAEHVGGIVEGSEQMGADGQHAAAITLAPIAARALGGGGTAQGNEHPIALLEATEGAVVDPEDLQPEGVEQLAQLGSVAGLQGDQRFSLGGLASFNDVGEPVAIAAGLLIGVLRGQAAADVDVGEIGAPQQGRLEFNLRDKDLHPRMGVADADGSLDLPLVGAAALDLPAAAAETQGGGRP